MLLQKHLVFLHLLVEFASTPIEVTTPLKSDHFFNRTGRKNEMPQNIPLGVPPDLQSGVKKVLTYYSSADLQSAASKNAIEMLLIGRGITNPPD